MTSDRWGRVQDLFEAALEQPETSRESFLEEACGADEDLRSEVRSLLVAHARTDAMLDAPLAVTGPDPNGEPLPPGTKVGEYEVQRLIGTGGFGRVYRGVHPVIRKQAAIKVLFPQFSASPEHAQRFINEARTVNEIGHPDIIDVFAFGETEDGSLFFVMELLDAPTLAEHLLEHAPLPLDATLAILRPLAAAVDAAHERGVVHRDLKPANVLLVTDPEGRRRPKLLDFGIAKLRRGPDDAAATATGTETADGRILGTPAYMSPEQARGIAVDRTTDVYAFGVMAYEMLTGRRPHIGGTPLEVLMKHVTEEVAPASTVVELPPYVDSALAAMLAKEPEDRPATCGDAIEALARGTVDPGEVPTVAAVSSASSAGSANAPAWGRWAFALAVVATLGIVLALKLGGSDAPADVAAAPAEAAAPVPASGPAAAESDPPSAAEPSPRAGVPAAPPPPKAQPEPPQTAQQCALEVVGAPKGTKVAIADGPDLGPVPGTIQLDASAKALELRFHRRGYEDARRTVVPCEDASLELAMKRKGAKLNPDLESPFRP